MEHLPTRWHHLGVDVLRRLSEGKEAVRLGGEGGWRTFRVWTAGT